MLKKIVLIFCLLIIVVTILLVGVVEAENIGATSNNSTYAISAANFYGFQHPIISDLYDFEGASDFSLVENIDKYLIINKTTGTIYERSMDSHSPYYNANLDLIKVYGGYGNYYLCDSVSQSNKTSRSNNTFYDLLNGYYIQLENKAQLQTNLESIKTQDLQENNTRIAVQSRWGVNDTYASTTADNYFSKCLEPTYKTIADFSDGKEGYMVINYGLPGGVISDNTKVAFEISRTERHGLVNRRYLKYDWKIPENDGSSCGVVAMTMALQYYQRCGIGNTIPASFLEAKSDVITYDREIVSSRVGGSGNTYEPEQKDYLAYHLWGTIDQLTPALIGPSSLSANSYVNLRDGINSFYNAYTRENTDLQLIFHANVCYDNMMGCVDSENVAIGMTGLTGNGYYQNDDNEWISTSITRHNMLIYGYCTSESDVLEDFICHSTWRYTENTSKMYVYKLNFLGNVTIEH